jgi:hypothetical protein
VTSRRGAHEPCPICGAGGRRERRWGAGLAVTTCVACGHRTADHEPVSDDPGDYHRQYDQGEFVEALRRTRVRQARRIVRAVAAHAPAARGLLDFGCGRGWLMEEARRAGLDPVGGADTSQLAVDEARARGFPAVRVSPERPEAIDAAVLGFAPGVLTLLDVVEHLVPGDAARVVSALVQALPTVELVVVKVPVADGLLYRGAEALARAGRTAALEQLYQVGTSPPHRSYFSRRSLRRFLSSGGLEIVETLDDRDFEPDALSGRVRALRALPRWGTAAAGTALATAIDLARLHDSAIAIARPRGSAS